MAFDLAMLSLLWSFSPVIPMAFLAGGWRRHFKQLVLAAALVVLLAFASGVTVLLTASWQY